MRISRRDFLTGSGAAIGGLAAGSILGVNSAAEAVTNAGSFPFFTTADLALTNGVDTDWCAGKTWKQTILYRAVQGYLTKGGCCIGGWYGISKAYKSFSATNAAKWDEVPDFMFKWGQGGGVGWGTVCGALNGATFATGLTVGDATKKSNIMDNVMSWYETALLPSNANEGDFAQIFANLVSPVDGTPITGWDVYTFTDSGATSGNLSNRTVSGTPLCHGSVSRFCYANQHQEASGGKDSKAKKARCARLTADVALYTAELIAAFKTNAGANVGKWVYTAPTEDCMDCHNNFYSYQNAAAGMDTEQGKMACDYCHDLPVDNAMANKAPACVDPKAGDGIGER